LRLSVLWRCANEVLTNNFDTPTGRIFLEDMKDEEVSINTLAQAIRVLANRISLIVDEA
jgi:plasmid maintenance system antidote protein VapI